MAEKDKLRYEAEKSLFTGPWTIRKGLKRPQDDSAPTRPRSAFLAWSNEIRADLTSTNGEISKLLSKMWKEAPPEIRKKYKDEENVNRKEYRVKMDIWKEKQVEKLKKRHEQ